MFGYLRFILASLVVLAHTGLTFYGLNQGVIAVVIFYILAGYVVSHIYEEVLINKKNKIIAFYKDRVLRIFPLYLYISFLTIIFITLTGYSNPNYSITAVLGNLFIIPLNYYMFADFTILKDPSANWWLIPPAWSLGTELQAYILLALGMRYKPLTVFLAFGSLIVYIAANLSILHPDYFGYRFIIGVFFIFAAGASIQKINTKNLNTVTQFDRYFPLFIWFVVVLLMILFVINNSFSPTYTRETLIGLLIGIPLIYTLSKVKYKIPFDATVGALSYGIFLSHFLSIWLLDFAGIHKNHSFTYLTLLVIICIIIAYTGVAFVERKVTNRRDV